MKELSVGTSFGTLAARVCADDECPEIFIFLRNEQGNELMLCVVSDLSAVEDEDILRLAVYGDTKAEDYTDRFLFRREDINDGKAMWM